MKTTLKTILATTAFSAVLASAALAQNGGTAGITTGSGSNMSGSAANRTGPTTGTGPSANTTMGTTGTSANNMEPAAGTTTTDKGANAVTDINGNKAAQRGGPVNAVLPSGMGTYTYYANSNVYYSPSTKTYYYQESGAWKSGPKLPASTKLGNGRSVQLQGEAK